jgi:hypothetical protein
MKSRLLAICLKLENLSIGYITHIGNQFFLGPWHLVTPREVKYGLVFWITTIDGLAKYGLNVVARRLRQIDNAKKQQETSNNKEEEVAVQQKTDSNNRMRQLDKRLFPMERKRNVGAAVAVVAERPKNIASTTSSNHDESKRVVGGHDKNNRMRQQQHAGKMNGILPGKKKRME